MPSSYTNSDGFEKIGVGEQANQWGASLNNNFDLLDQACDGVAEVVLSNNSYNLTISPGQASNGRSRVVILSGNPTSTVAVTVTPANISKVYWIVNQTSQVINITNGSGSALSIAAGTTAPAFCDGSGNVVGLQQGNSAFSSINVSGQGTFGTVNTNELWVNTHVDFPAAGSVNIGGVPLNTYVNSLIPSLTTLPGTLVCSKVSAQGVSGGSWVIFDFGTSPGTRVRIAIGSGVAGNGNTIPVPTGFNTQNMIATASMNYVSQTPGNNLDHINCSVGGGGVITATGGDGSGHVYIGTANWMACAWLTGY